MISLANKCPTCGSDLPNDWKMDWVCSLVLCSCRHGGRAWHNEVFGKCSYPNCECDGLKPIEATVYPKNDKSKFRFISGDDFRKLYNQNKYGIFFS